MGTGRGSRCQPTSWPLGKSFQGHVDWLACYYHPLRTQIGRIGNQLVPLSHFLKLSTRSMSILKYKLLKTFNFSVRFWLFVDFASTEIWGLKNIYLKLQSTFCSRQMARWVWRFIEESSRKKSQFWCSCLGLEHIALEKKPLGTEK